MKLWALSLTDHDPHEFGWREITTSMIIWASNETEARKTAYEYPYYPAGKLWLDEKRSSCVEIELGTKPYIVHTATNGEGR